MNDHRPAASETARIILDRITYRLCWFGALIVASSCLGAILELYPNFSTYHWRSQSVESAFDVGIIQTRTGVAFTDLDLRSPHPDLVGMMKYRHSLFPRRGLIFPTMQEEQRQFSVNFWGTFVTCPDEASLRAGFLEHWRSRNPTYSSVVDLIVLPDGYYEHPVRWGIPANGCLALIPLWLIWRLLAFGWRTVKKPGARVQALQSGLCPNCHNPVIDFATRQCRTCGERWRRYELPGDDRAASIRPGESPGLNSLPPWSGEALR